MSLIVALCFLIVAPYLVRRLVEARVSARACAAIYTGVLVSIMASVTGLLMLLVLFLWPHWAMAGLEIGCRHQSLCLHSLPLWAQSGLWFLFAGMLALVLWRVAGIMGAALLAGRRVRRAIRKGGSTQNSAVSFPLYRVDDEAVFACTAGFVRPLIAVSSGLQDALDPGEFAVVVSHERAHARARDNVAILVARVAEGAFFLVPGIRIAGRGLRRSIELAADTHATRCVGDPLLVASSVTRVAGLASRRRAGGLISEPVMAGFSDEDLVVQRVRRLLSRQPAASRGWMVGVAVALALGFFVLAASAVTVAESSISRGAEVATCAQTSG